MKGFMGVLLLKEKEGERDKREIWGNFLGMVFVNLPEHFPTWPRTFFFSL